MIAYSNPYKHGAVYRTPDPFGLFVKYDVNFVIGNNNFFAVYKINIFVYFLNKVTTQKGYTLLYCFIILFILLYYLLFYYNAK